MLDYEESDNCIDFIIMYVFFVITFLALIFNPGSSGNKFDLSWK